jgi:hypothetical protein
MTIFPHNLIGRLLLALWLAACVAVLIFAFNAREIHDTDIAFLSLMLVLTFPIGYAFAALVGVVFYALNSMFGIVVPGGFIPNLLSWVFFVAAGYFQWFIVVPWLYKKLRSHLTLRSSGTARKRAAP